MTQEDARRKRRNALMDEAATQDARDAALLDSVLVKIAAINAAADADARAGRGPTPEQFEVTRAKRDAELDALAESGELEKLVRPVTHSTNDVVLVSQMLATLVRYADYRLDLGDYQYFIDYKYITDEIEAELTRKYQSLSRDFIVDTLRSRPDSDHARVIAMVRWMPVIEHGE